MARYRFIKNAYWEEPYGIAIDKRWLSVKYFSYFLKKTYIVGTYKLQHMFLSSNKINIITFWLTHCSRETRKRVIGKQCRPRSDAAECGV